MCILLVKVLIESTFARLLALDQLSADPASTLVRATGRQIVTPCKAVCEGKKHIFGSPDEQLASFLS